MNDKFKNVPVDPDTRIHKRSLAHVGGYEALHERWSFDGVKGETFVFLSDDVASVSEEDLRNMVSATEGVDTGSQMTLKRSESGYTFVNFNFRY